MPRFRPSLLLPLFALALAAQPVQAPLPEDLRALMLQARTLQLRGNGTEPLAAAALYRKVLAQVPDSAEVNLRLSESLEEAGDVTGALPHARRAVELNPTHREALAHLGLLTLKAALKDNALLPAARAALVQATKALPGDPELWARLAEVGEFQKDAELALRGWLKVARLRPGLPQISGIWERVILHAKTLNRYEPRREAVLAMAQARPGGPSAEPGPPDGRALRLLEELAKEQVKVGYLAHAEESFRLLGRLLPEHLTPILENVAHVQVQAGRYEEAMATLEQASALQKTPRNRFNLAICHMYLGHFAKAEPLLRALLPDLPDSADAQPSASAGRILLATAVALQDRPQDLLRLLKEWPQGADQAELAALRFQALVRLENWKVARTELKAGMARFDKHPLFLAAKDLPPKALEEGMFSRKLARGVLQQLAQEHRAAVLAEFRQWEPSLTAVRRAREAYEGRTSTLLLLEANDLDQLGRYTEAIAVLRQAQKGDTANPTLQNNLGYLLLERGGDLAEAAALIEAAVKADPNNGSVQDSWGWTLFRQGRFEEAEAALRKAADLNPYSYETRRHLGETLVKLGREEEALEQWERALAFSFPERAELEKRFRELQVVVARREQARDAEGGGIAAPPAPEPEDAFEDGP